MADTWHVHDMHVDDMWHACDMHVDDTCICINTYKLMCAILVASSPAFLYSTRKKIKGVNNVAIK